MILAEYLRMNMNMSEHSVVQIDKAGGWGVMVQYCLKGNLSLFQMNYYI